MADITKLRAWADAYGVAVRAGVLTPSMVDEEYVRNLFGLPEMPEEVRALWFETKTRAPITIQPEEQATVVDDAAG